MSKTRQPISAAYLKSWIARLKADSEDLQPKRFPRHSGVSAREWHSSKMCLKTLLQAMEQLEELCKDRAKPDRGKPS